MKVCKSCGKKLSSTRQTAIYCLDCSEINRKKRVKEYQHNKIYSDTIIIDKVYKKYLASAKRRNHTFSIPKSIFKKYYKKKCFYCGDTLKSVGFDRVDNIKGYIIDNIVPCCGTCNMMKRSMGIHSFINQIIKINNNHKGIIGFRHPSGA